MPVLYPGEPDAIIKQICWLQSEENINYLIFGRCFFIFIGQSIVSIASLMSFWLKSYGSVHFSNQTSTDFSNFLIVALFELC